MKNDEVMNAIIDIYYTHVRRYGYRRIALELAKRGFTINHKKVKRLMTVMGLYGITLKAKYKSYKGDMNGTVKNQLLTEVVDEKNIRHITKEILQQLNVMKNGQRMYLSFI